MNIEFSKLKLFLKFFKFNSPYKKLWFWVVVLSNFGIVLGLINPFLAKFIIDEGLVKKDFKAFAIFAILGAIIYLVVDLVNRVKDYLYHYIRIKAHFQLNKKVFTRLQIFPLSWFKDKATAEHIYKLNFDIDNIAEFIAIIAPAILFVLIRFLLILTVVFYLNWKMALLSLIISPFLFIPGRYFGRKMRLILEDLITSSESIFQNLEEVFSHIQLVKVFGRESSAIRLFLKGLVANTKINLKSIKLEAASGFVTETLSKVTIGLITFYGAYQIIKGRMSLGSLTAIMVYFSQLVGLENELVNFFQTSLNGLISCDRIAKILDEDQGVIVNANAQRVIFKRGEITFKNVSFGYTSKSHVLKNISFNLLGGSRIALVGPSGCGKTTLLCLILGLYDLWQGDIFIDNYNIKDLNPGGLREQIGFAMQEPFLWNDTVANNIKYAKEDASAQEISRISKLTGVDDFVRDLPRGYDTIIGENACKISEGQKQKIAIARAAIKNPKIMILDEAMASMDSSSEEKIISNLKQAQPGQILIAVSHRLSTIMDMDMVYYLSSPEVIIIDKPEALLKNNSEFRNLFGRQERT